MSNVRLAAADGAEVAMLFDIPLDQVTEAHLQSLVTDSVTEDRQLEYKLTLPTKQRSDVIEFLKDIQRRSSGAPLTQSGAHRTTRVHYTMIPMATGPDRSIDRGR